MWPEIIISGFVWLLFLWSIVDWNLSIDEVREQFASIVSMNTGQISAASGLIVAASYFLGALARRILGWVGVLIRRILTWARSSGAIPDVEGKKQKDFMTILSKGNKVQLETHEDGYSRKLLFGSVASGLTFLLFSVVHWIWRLENAFIIICLSAVLIVLTWVAFYVQKREFDEYNESLVRKLEAGPS
jgi:hypothetical protein